VLEKGIKGGWVDAGDEAASSRLLGLALESPIALADARRRVRARFACTRNQAAKDLIEAAEKEDRCSLILLAYAESCPERFGFVTQESLDNERCADLRKRAQQLATALFWLRLRQVLASNPSVFGRPRILAASWLGLAAFAWRAGLLSNAHNWIALFILVPPLLRVVHCAGLRVCSRVTRRLRAGGPGTTARGVVLRSCLPRWAELRFRPRIGSSCSWRF